MSAFGRAEFKRTATLFHKFGERYARNLRRDGIGEFVPTRQAGDAREMTLHFYERINGLANGGA
jgi:hypothetical protein